MRIAVANALLPTDEQSGVPYQVHRLANALVDRAHDVTVFSFSPKPAEAKYDLRRFKRIGAIRKLDPFVFGFKLRSVDFSNFDVVHAHGDSFLLSRTHPHVRTFHGSAADEARAAKTLKRRLFFTTVNLLEQFSSTISDHNVGISEATLRRFGKRSSSLIPCGVDAEYFSPGAKTEVPTILFVGTTGGRKRGAWLADIFSREVVPLVPNAELLMVSDENVALPNVRNLGRVSDERLAELYRSSWLFCLPSTYEGFGVPYIEAMASGTPVVATPNVGALEVLAHGRYGVLPADDQLGATLVELLTRHERREELKKLGLSRAEAYRWTSIAEAYERLFESLLPERELAS